MASTNLQNPIVYFDILVQDYHKPQLEVIGRISFELFSHVTPKTAENFRSLCTGSRGEGQKGKPLHYLYSIFHRMIRDFVCQGGDFTNFDGTGGESIYGPFFDDENFTLKHEKYCLSMANSGKNRNSSQFFITTGDTPWLDGKHVVFGRVIDGFDVVDQMNAYAGDMEGAPLKHVVIVRCGQYSKELSSLVNARLNHERELKLQDVIEL